jgi:CBS domain-containing protein
MRVSDVMTRRVACVRADESCSAAVQFMWDCDCGALPVLSESGDRVVGMITDRDICMAAWSKGRAPSEIPVADAMSRELFACAESDGVGLAENLMRSRQIRRVPVLDAEQRLAGIISLADIARQSEHQIGRPAATEVAPREVAQTLASICRRSHVSLVSSSAAL